MALLRRGLSFCLNAASYQFVFDVRYVLKACNYFQELDSCKKGVLLNVYFVEKEITVFVFFDTLYKVLPHDTEQIRCSHEKHFLQSRSVPYHFKDGCGLYMFAAYRWDAGIREKSLELETMNMALVK